MDLTYQQKTDRDYMLRCIQLAERGAGAVAPNPMVGSVLVHENRIIGEGYHQRYGEAHAEVNCINSVKQPDLHLIPYSTLYVSLEPCAHFGKTPPCADLIIHHRIPFVVIGCRDPFEQVNGKGIEKLLAANVEVRTGILEQACQELNKRFFTFHLKKRPYIILKWAQTADNFIAGTEGSPRLLISNDQSNRLVHKWRSEEAAIMVGRRTVQADDPSLTNRLWMGTSPVRLIIDPSQALGKQYRVMNGEVETIVFVKGEKELDDSGSVAANPQRISVSATDFLVGVLDELYAAGISSVLVEGGATLIQSLISKGTWDEARIITNGSVRVGDGLRAPVLPFYKRMSAENYGTDHVEIFINKP